MNYRWVESYLFEGSPQFTGTIPSYGLVDAQVSKEAKAIHCTFRVGASNVLNNKVYMVYGGPEVGRLAYFSVSSRYWRQEVTMVGRTERRWCLSWHCFSNLTSYHEEQFTRSRSFSGRTHGWTISLRAALSHGGLPLR